MQSDTPGPKTYHNHLDHLGSTAAVSTSIGYLDQSLSYYPFGSTRTSAQYGPLNQSNQFIGQNFDEESSLSYLNARYYDANRGQMLSQDPVNLENPSQFILDPQQLNTYSYSRNNPINRIDPDGRTPTLTPTQKKYFQSELDKIKKDAARLMREVNDFSRSAAKGAIDPVGGAKNAADKKHSGSSRAGSAIGAIVGVGASFLAPESRILNVVGKTMNLPKTTLICRGGACEAIDFITATGVKREANGTLSNVSVQVGINGETKAELIANLPARFNGQASFTAVDVAQSTPAILQQTGSIGSTHFNMGNLTPEQYVNLFKNDI